MEKAVRLRSMADIPKGLGEVSHGFQPTPAAIKALKVQIIGLAFRAGTEAETCFDTAKQLDPEALCVAIVTDGDAPLIRQAWKDGQRERLLLIRVPSCDFASTAKHVLTAQPSGPLAVLLAQSPVPSSRWPFLRNMGVAEAIRGFSECRDDIQVHLYSPRWNTDPPRIR